MMTRGESTEARRHRRANDPPDAELPEQQHRRAADQSPIARYLQWWAFCGAVFALGSCAGTAFMGFGGLYTVPGKRMDQFDQRLTALETDRARLADAQREAGRQVLDSMTKLARVREDKAEIAVAVGCLNARGRNVLTGRLASYCDSVTANFVLR